MIEPETGKPGNWTLISTSLAALFGGLSAWFYRKAGQTPRPEPSKEDNAAFREALKPILAQLEGITASLSTTHDLAVNTNEKVERMEGRFEMLGRRLARMEGHQQGAGD